MGDQAEMLDFGLEAIGFEDVPGWADDDHLEALAAFRKAAAIVDPFPPKRRATDVNIAALLAAIDQANRERIENPSSARDFFEAHFAPFRINTKGFFTGYYEPVVLGNREKTARFRHPLYERPDDLIDIPAGTSVPGMPENTRFARLTDGKLTAYPDREAITNGFLDRRGLELVWLADAVDAFYIHIQGSARISLADKEEMRLTYAAKSGHPYTAIGRVLIDEGCLPPGGADMQAIRRWLTDHPDQVSDVLNRNRSFIFFKEAPVADKSLGPVAAARVPLTPGRSLAVDRLIHSFHLPVFVSTELADGTPYRRLMIAQDTGSAIVGPARGDIFMGSGDAAGQQAGALQSAGDFIVLLPRSGHP